MVLVTIEKTIVLPPCSDTKQVHLIIRFIQNSKSFTETAEDMESRVSGPNWVECVWRRFGAVGSDVAQINEVALRWARLALGWVTVSGSTPTVGNLSRSNQLPGSTQPGHPSVGRC